MMRFSLLLVAALLGAAVSAPAQVSIEARIGRNIVGQVVVGARDHGDHYRGDRGDRGSRDHRRHVVPVRRVPAPRGHWETVQERYLVPGYWSEQHVPPTYGWIVDSCGHRRWGVVDAGGCRRVWIPARWETRSNRVWVPC
jgi:hypothetical protein